MDEHNHPSHSGEEHYYSQPIYSQGGKIESPPVRQPGRRLLPIFIVVTTILLVVVIVFGAVVVHLLTTPSQGPRIPIVPATPTIAATAQVQPSVTAASAPTSTSTQVQPSATVAPPASTSCASPCVYQENGSDGWQGWSLTSDWRIVDNNKLLSNDGSAGSNQAGPSAIPPYSLPQGTQNFAIEVGVTIPQGMSDAHVSITACGSTTSNGWQGYEGVISSDNQAQIYADQDQLAHTDFTPNQQLYIYRLEVKGNVISQFVNGGLVVQATDNKFLPCGSQIGIVSSQAVVHVSSFKVILL